MTIYKSSDLLAILSYKKKSLKWRLKVIAAIHIENQMSEKRRKKTRKPRNFKRNRGFAINELANLPVAIFKRMFRMDKATFYELVQDLEPIIGFKGKNQINGSFIPVVTRLAVTLRWLAGASYIDLCFAWGISKTVFFSERGVLWPTIEALDGLLSIGFPIDDDFALQK